MSQFRFNFYTKKINTTIFINQLPIYLYHAILHTILHKSKHPNQKVEIKTLLTRINICKVQNHLIELEIYAPLRIRKTSKYRFRCYPRPYL